MLIKLAPIIYSISVIIRVPHAHSSVRIDLDVVISVTHVEALYTPIGLYRPMKVSVFFRNRYYTDYRRNEIIIVKALANHPF